ncbi:MAG: translocation/assembly module TamB, partial [Chitinophagaceae bacterium]|nr:translocation/assembly module TamB [Chitinophagaceae bacterium]
ATARLSHSLGTTVQVKKAYLGFLNRVNLEGILVKDQQNDTLVSIGKLQVNVTDWLIFKDTVVIRYAALHDVRVRFYRDDKIWNHAFLTGSDSAAAAFPTSDTTSASTPAPAAKTAPLALRLEVLEISNLRFLEADRWKGKSLLAGVQYLHLRANEFDLENQRFDIRRLYLEKPEYRELKRYGKWSAEDSIAYYRRLDSLDRLRTFPESWNPGGMQLLVRDLQLKDGLVEFYNRLNRPFVRGEFEEKDIIIRPISGRIRNLQLDHDTLTAQADITARERSGLQIKRLVTKVRIHPQLMEFDQLDLRINESRLGPYYAMRYTALDRMEYFLDSVRITARLQNSTVSMQDIAFFAPELKGIKQVVNLTGAAEGTVSDFVVRDLDLATGRSRLVGTYSMRGLTDIENTIIQFNTPGSKLALEDVAVWAPALLQMRETPVAKLGVVTYTGNFTGTVYNFMARGTLQTDVGHMGATLSMRLSGPRQGFEGRVQNASIQGGKLLDVPDLGMIRFDGRVWSSGFRASDALNLEGDVQSLSYRGYTYSDLQVEGRFQHSALDASLSVSDSNLQANISTRLNFRSQQQGYNARGVVGYADLYALGLAKQHLRASGLFDVDFKGSNPDDFVGYARLYEAEVYDSVGLMNMDSLVIRSAVEEGNRKTITLNTNEGAATISGQFRLSDLPNSFKAFLNSYYPSFVPAPARPAPNQDFTFSLETRNVEPLMHFISPQLRGLNNSQLRGSLNTISKELLIDAQVPYFSYNGVEMKQVSIRGSGGQQRLQLDGNIEDFSINDSLGFPAVRLSINTVSDTTALKLTTSTQGQLGDAVVSATVLSRPDGFEARFDESSFIINNKKWVLSETSHVELKNGYLIATGVDLSNDMQRIRMHTQPSDEGNWNDLFVDISEFNIGDVLPFFLQEPRLEGLLNGRVVVEDPMGKPFINAQASARRFYFNNDSVGTVTLSGTYQAAENKLLARFDSRNPEYDMGGLVRINLNDTAGQQIDADIELRNERISVLENYLSMVFRDMDGYASGNLKVVGSLAKPAILGETRLTNAWFTVDYTGCTYRIDSSTLRFGDNYLSFGSMTVRDLKGRKGTLDGIMYHRFFDSLSFNLRMRTDGMQVLNTGARDNDLFYGRAVAKASFELRGPLNNLVMKVAGTTTDTSHIIIANKTGKESGEADYIVFKEYGTEQVRVVDSLNTNIHMELDLTATPLCTIDVIMDELSGDRLSATGAGSLQIRTGTIDATVMRGRYQIEKGSYNYSFQTLIKKPFELEGGENSYIEWNGDPYNANLNVGARYVAQNVSLRDLMGSEQNRTVLDESAQNYKGDVYVKARVTGLLSAPQLAFDIEFPPGSPMQNNVSAQAKLGQIRADNSEMLKQVTYLIVFRSFAPYKEGAGSRNPGTDLAVNTVSELLSSQMEKILTNVVQDITGDQSLNVNFSTEFYNSSSVVSGNVNASSGYDRVSFNFMLNKSYFNNRVVVNLGSDFDMDVRSTTTSGFQFLPDVSVEFILTPNRRLRAIIFKKDNLDFAGRRNRAGVSLSYRKDFDKLISQQRDDGLLFIRKSEEN